MPREKRNYNVSAEDFVRAWNESSSVQEVADRLGMPKPIAHARACNYRRKGIPIKPMRRQYRRKLDIPALQRLAKECLEPKEDTVVQRFIREIIERR